MHDTVLDVPEVGQYTHGQQLTTAIRCCNTTEDLLRRLTGREPLDAAVKFDLSQLQLRPKLSYASIEAPGTAALSTGELNRCMQARDMPVDARSVV